MSAGDRLIALKGYKDCLKHLAKDLADEHLSADYRDSALHNMDMCLDMIARLEPTVDPATVTVSVGPVGVTTTTSAVLPEELQDRVEKIEAWGNVINCTEAFFENISKRLERLEALWPPAPDQKAPGKTFYNCTKKKII